MMHRSSDLDKPVVQPFAVHALEVIHLNAWMASVSIHVDSRFSNVLVSGNVELTHSNTFSHHMQIVFYPSTNFD